VQLTSPNGCQANPDGFTINSFLSTALVESYLLAFKLLYEGLCHVGYSVIPEWCYLLL